MTLEEIKSRIELILYESRVYDSEINRLIELFKDNNIPIDEKTAKRIDKEARYQMLLFAGANKLKYVEDEDVATIYHGADDKVTLITNEKLCKSICGGLDVA